MGRRPRYGMLGARSVLVPPKAPYPLQMDPASIGRPLGRSSRSAAERRRKNLTYLAIFIIGTFLLGLVPSLRFLLVFNIIADVLLVLYLGLALYVAVWPPPSEREHVAPAAEAPPQRVAGL
jgi:hypothetical protein